MTLMSNSNLWLCEPDAFAQLQAEFLAIDPKAADFHSRFTPSVPLTIGSNGVAVVDVVGPLIRRAGPLCAILGATSTDLVAEAVARAEANESVDTIIMRFETPGGETYGIAEAADVIRRAGQTKRTVALAESMCCSGGIWLASQCREFYAEPSALVGAIGCYISMWDLSKAFEQRGIEVVKIDSGGVKGMGEPGTAITEEHKAHVQEIVDSIAVDFKQAIQIGRGMSAAQVSAIADGRIFPSSDALARGLVDGIRTFETITQSLVEEVNKMAIQATVADLRAALPNADPEFLLSAVEANMTVEQAKVSWSAVERARATANPEPRGVGNPAAPVPGVNRHPVASAEVNEDDAADFMTAVDKYMADHDCSRAQAVAAVGRRNPEAHRAAVMAANNDSYAHHLIDQRFAS